MPSRSTAADARSFDRQSARPLDGRGSVAGPVGLLRIGKVRRLAARPLEVLPLLAGLFLGGLLCAGCASVDPSQTSMVVDDAEYAQVFDAARESLVASGFVLDRIDAVSGVLTTKPARTAGLATPWAPQQVGIDQEIFDLANPVERVVVMRFEPIEPAVDATSALDTTSPSIAGSAHGSGSGTASPATVALRVDVRATVRRVHRPGLRAETESVRTSTTAVDPALVQRGMRPESIEVLERDDRLGARILDRLRRALEHAQEGTQASD